MTQDTSLYGSDPDKFRPERFADLSPDEAKRIDPKNIIFGYGRRRVFPYLSCNLSRLLLSVN